MPHPFPQVLHFPPALYTHVLHDLKKQLVLILNKVPALLTLWMELYCCTRWIWSLPKWAWLGGTTSCPGFLALR